MPSGPRLVRRNKNICLCPINFTGLVSPTGGNHRKSKERASEEEAVNAMKWKQLKEGERGGTGRSRTDSLYVRLSLPLLAGPAQGARRSQDLDGSWRPLVIKIFSQNKVKYNLEILICLCSCLKTPTQHKPHISSVFTCFCIVQRVDPVRLRGHIVSSAHSAVSPCGPAWPAARSGKLGWWSDELTQRVALWGNFGKNAFSLHFRNKFDLQN